MLAQIVLPLIPKYYYDSSVTLSLALTKPNLKALSIALTKLR